MPALDDVPADRAPALLALTARLKHDLGKYIAFGARWLPEDASVTERREALAADLLHTRRGPAGEQDAHQVWEPYAGALLGRLELEDGGRLNLSDDPDVVRIVRAMDALTSVADALRDGGEVSASELDRALTLTRQVSNACRDLHRRAHEASANHG